MKISKNDFNRVDNEGTPYWSFIKDNYEICLELCFSGFDVAIYRIDGEGVMDLAEPKICTEENINIETYMHTNERTEWAWNKALELANILFVKYLGNDGGTG